MAAAETIPFAAAGRIPAPGDNCAIVIRRLDAGARVELPGGPVELAHTALEGHRLVIAPIGAGEALTSWGLPFGRALKPLRPGDYVCNATMIEALRSRHVDFAVPDAPNFTDFFQPYVLDERTFRPAAQVELYSQPRTFAGFARPGGRGAGTRNFVVVLGTSSLTGSLARAVAQQFKDAPQQFPNVDGVVAIAHTEGGESGRPNNLEFTLRTLAGFAVNPNVGALLALDLGSEPVNNDALRDWMRRHQYPLDAVPHRFFRADRTFALDLAEAARHVRELLPLADATPRTPQLMRHLKVGLQCGGSDAFSGVSGNPLAGIITREVVRHGGAANLAETDELHGAESYVLAKVRDLETARRFLRTLDSFEERLGWHGVTGQTNPSGGNIFRGLYNIAIKSIGAARKKDPAVRLDYVIGFGEPMREPGFCFMDSPGNDLESIAGQVAAGCNLIVFSTGNGSVTNHPFVPTIKVMTNTGRFNLLSRDMDFNAGRYLDGEPLEALGAEAFDYTVRVASGFKTVGERAGHSQAQLWREWRQSSAARLPAMRQRPRPAGEPVPLRPDAIDLQPLAAAVGALSAAAGVARAKHLRLVIPTSLCAGQVGRLIADRLNAGGRATHYVVLPHTEGCGVSGEAIEILERVLAGYAVHPLSERTLMLEHGCEKTHNDAVRNYFHARGWDSSRLGFASIQLDGGIEKVADKVAGWFDREEAGAGRAKRPADFALCLGLTAVGEVPANAAAGLALLARAIVAAGGTVIVPSSSSLLQTSAFTGALFAATPAPTLAYGDVPIKPGFHVMELAGGHHVEALTGLGAAGVTGLLVHVPRGAVQAHPFVPTVQISSAPDAVDVDVVLSPVEPAAAAQAVLECLTSVWRGERTPAMQAAGNVDFQVSRGWLGVST